LASDYKETPFFDVLVVDNDSRDQTLQVLKAQQLKLPSMSAYAWPVNTGSVYNTQQLSSFVDTEFMLWLTDDDYLLEGAIKKCLLKIPTFQEQNIHWIFSPLDTFNPDSSLLCTVSPGFPHSQIIPAWSSHCARYAWGFSRQIWKTEHLRACQERINASSFLSNSGYWMIYPAVLAISASKAFFWNESLVHHVYGNVVHWEEFGPEGLKRKARLSLDFNMTYLLGALDFLKARISINRVYSQLVQFTKVASHENYYRGGRFATINLRSCLSLVVYQQTYIRHFLAIGFFFLILISYPSLLINRISKRFGFG
jgi:glycosyltransferase involved in cell wall biosynthesis